MNNLKLLILSLILALSACDRSNEEKNSNSADKEIHMCSFDLLDLKDGSSAKPDAAIIDWPKWTPGQTIRIKFLNGDIALQEKVKEYAQEWTFYANLKFEYVPDTQNADIRISFRWKNDGGSWSVLGMNSTSATPNYQNEPSMNFGWTSLGSESTTKREVLHEFGHALGLIHETTSPAANIPWNLPKVYQYYSDLMGFTKEETDAFVINKAVLDESNYSEYDKLSIMHYYIDPALTLDGIRISESNDLSITDKNSINKWYPFPIVSVLEPGTSYNDISWDKRVKSPNGRYSLEFTPGLLHIVDLNNNEIVWEVGNSSYRRKPVCYFESNGNIIIKGAKLSYSAIETIYTSNTSEFSGAKLYLQNDGTLELIYNGVVKWSSKLGNI